MTYPPMETAPRDGRTIVGKHRDGYELRVKWDKRSAPASRSFLGGRDPEMVWGWCTRENERAVLFKSDLVGWREIEDGED